MKIIKLIAENFKILKAVEIEPGNNNTIIITGKNGAGKTSVLDAIAIAMAGKKAVKELKKAIREGEDKAFVTIETEKYIITRKWTQNDSGTLVVKDNEGRTYPSPQAFLDKIIGELTFDPLEFSLSKPQEQRQILINLIGQADILAKLDDKRQIAYNNRTDINRELKSLTTRFANLPTPNLSLKNQSKKDISEEMADKYDFQVWLEIVSDDKREIGICIEEGEVTAINGKELTKCIKK